MYFYSEVVSLFVSFGGNPAQREVMFQTKKSQVNVDL